MLPDALARALREDGRSYRWKATARFYDEFDEPFLAEAVEAGCGLLCLGLESYDDDAVNVVVLCSDGVANVGDTMPGVMERVCDSPARCA